MLTHWLHPQATDLGNFKCKQFQTMSCCKQLCSKLLTKELPIPFNFQRITVTKNCYLQHLVWWKLIGTEFPKAGSCGGGAGDVQLDKVASSTSSTSGSVRGCRQVSKLPSGPWPGPAEQGAENSWVGREIAERDMQQCEKLQVVQGGMAGFCRWLRGSNVKNNWTTQITGE